MNKDTKHTPGPWHHESDSPLPDIETQIELCRDDMGTDREWQPVFLCDSDGPSEVVALCHPLNAPLIAAAPDLKAALQRLLELCENGEGADMYGQQQAREAIAKSTLAS